jgi:hypothetical protein
MTGARRRPKARRRRPEHYPVTSGAAAPLVVHREAFPGGRKVVAHHDGGAQSRTKNGVYECL